MIIVTSSDAPTDQGEAARLANGYFRKPPNYGEFMKLGTYLKEFLVERGLL